MATSLQILEKLVRRYCHLCRKAHEKAAQGNWQNFSRLGPRQWRLMALLQCLFAQTPPSQPLLVFLGEAKEHLDQAIALAEQQKQELLTKINALKAGKKSIALYHDTERAV